MVQFGFSPNQTSSFGVHAGIVLVGVRWRDISMSYSIQSQPFLL